MICSTVTMTITEPLMMLLRPLFSGVKDVSVTGEELFQLMANSFEVHHGGVADAG